MPEIKRIKNKLKGSNANEKHFDELFSLSEMM